MNMSAPNAQNECRGVKEILSLIGEKWTIQVVVALRLGPRRFNEIARQVSGISQQMLTRTLKTLERDGIVERTVHTSTPPRVEYSLTPLGHSLAENVRQLAEWATAQQKIIDENRLQYDTAGGHKNV